MRRVACSILVALVAASGAVAASSPPSDGFRESTPLSLRVAKISGVPGAKVYCARNYTIWREWVAANSSVHDGSAFTFASRKAVYAAPDICVWPERWLRGKDTDLFELAEGILTLTHESAHVSGIRDEHAAECWAMKRVASVARVHFGVKKALPRVLAFVREQHSLLPPPYSDPC